MKTEEDSRKFLDSYDCTEHPHTGHMVVMCSDRRCFNCLGNTAAIHRTHKQLADVWKLDLEQLDDS